MAGSAFSGGGGIPEKLGDNPLPCPLPQVEQAGAARVQRLHCWALCFTTDINRLCRLTAAELNKGGKKPEPQLLAGGPTLTHKCVWGAGRPGLPEMCQPGGRGQFHVGCPL